LESQIFSLIVKLLIFSIWSCTEGLRDPSWTWSHQNFPILKLLLAVTNFFLFLIYNLRSPAFSYFVMVLKISRIWKHNFFILNLQ
jgi:hypothetical protein